MKAKFKIDTKDHAKAAKLDRDVFHYSHVFFTKENVKNAEKILDKSDLKLI